MNSPLRRSLLLALSLLFAIPGCSRDGADSGPKGIGVAPTATPGEFGRYHALLIGIDGYSHWPSLRFAETDATDIGNLLELRYGFARENVTRLLGRDATRSKILNAIRQKLESLDEHDNLLIYYACTLHHIRLPPPLIGSHRFVEYNCRLRTGILHGSCSLSDNSCNHLVVIPGAGRPYTVPK